MKRVKIFRIATVSHSLSILLKGQFLYLKEKGYDFYLICNPDENIVETSKQEGTNFISLRLTRKITPLQDLGCLLRLIFLIIKERPDIVHTHSPKAGLIGMLASYVCRVPLRVHTVAGLPLVERTGLIKELLILLEKLCYKCANKVLFNSAKQAQFVADLNWISKDKIDIIGAGSSNGIDLEYFSSTNELEKAACDVREQLLIKKDDVVLTFIGRMSKSKGINELVAAFNILSNDYSNLKLLLVGADEPIEPLTAETYGLIKSRVDIIRIGHQRDIRPYFLIADIFIFPSYREGFPQVLMQASVMNCCIVATDINGCNEIVHNMENGLLIPVKSIQAIVDACSFLIENSEVREKLTCLGAEKIISKFDQKRFWENLHQFYVKELIWKKSS